MSRNAYIALASIGSVLLLAGAYAFQHLGGLAPCSLCLWQRWPHVAAAFIGLFALALGRWSHGRFMPWLGMLAALTSAGIAAYHTGVERDWWEGPTACSGGGIGAGSGADLLSLEGPLGVVMCDEVAWQMLGLSMASWNMLASLALAGFWAMAARR
ncbi:Disulfide bond formation protein DsbB [Roseovarius nanhaiticus]|uniref:Disulfide bond formation protein DsbB n=1 Tax=Roseovarius nanhaiticus TaxID=573024 RepID=A0A1N7GBQ8_9RHOB|nr:disulfide bond formation protein B [Roseovarius nanhaiticus]SEK31674.1 Disulfide bond formation protein DsbB [Roseovarius nanhaiticus]SIS09950.1 Disulfide bond formation protein DsbB [Roseovarius nanhaiticus]